MRTWSRAASTWRIARPSIGNIFGIFGRRAGKHPFHFRNFLRELERRAVLEAMRRTNSHCARAAELLGITDRTLREKIRRYRRDGHLAEDGTWVRETA